MLNSKDLNDGFRGLMDPDYFNFVGYKTDINQVAQEWANVFKNFYLNMIMPIPGAANPNLFSALNLFKIGLISAIKTQNVINQFELLVRNLHLGVCTGVTMTGIYTTTPPTNILSLRDCFSTSFSAAQVAKLLSVKIFTWIMPTFSTLVAPPNTIIKWM